MIRDAIHDLVTFRWLRDGENGDARGKEAGGGVDRRGRWG